MAQTEEQDDLFSIKGMVREPDHITSIQAAVSVTPRKSKLQQEILEAFRKYGPMNDDILDCLPEFKGFAATTVSKRRTELYHKGLVRVVPGKYGISRAGSKQKVWEINE